MKLLIVEDDEKTSRALEAGLAGEGFTVAVARSGEDGFLRLNTESFDLLVRGGWRSGAAADVRAA